MGIWLLNGFDLAFTIISNQHGLFEEENPLARQMLDQGIASIILYKIGLVLIGSYPLLRFRTARITELGTLVILLTSALLAFRWSTCFELYTLSLSNSLNITEIRSASTASLQ